VHATNIVDLTAYRARALANPRSPAMTALTELIAQVAPGMISVLILGETGTGKEVLAEWVHRLSRRADRPLVRLNCAALSETLLESELFGHERGAFTGAVAAKPGLLETADGGTVFLDEVGELPLSVQVKLLRVLEDRAVLPVGGLKPRPIDVRFIAATNRDLAHEVERGRFRQDLFFRLDGVTLELPPLRERTDEIAGLARSFVAVAWRSLGHLEVPAPVISAAALDRLVAHPWPGNIRELRNVIERATLLCQGGPIEPVHVLLGTPRRIAITRELPPLRLPSLVGRPRATRSPDEKARVVDALARCDGNQTHAAKLLGISRGALIGMLERYEIARPRRRARPS
jgi:transcriptional regulator with GAF, ATPase, and Fis domain